MKNASIAVVLGLFVIVGTAAAHAQQTVQVFVPGNASGYFGTVDVLVPLVPAITVNGPGTITVSYNNGMVKWGSGEGQEVGPNGGPYPNNYYGLQFPLEEAKGTAPHKEINNIAALMGVFVCASRANHAGFAAVDGTKNAATVGIMPGGLFFIGTGKTFQVKEAGTLFLGINDAYVSDNGGGFNVTVTGP